MFLPQIHLSYMQQTRRVEPLCVRGQQTRHFSHLVRSVGCCLPKFAPTLRDEPNLVPPRCPRFYFWCLVLFLVFLLFLFSSSSTPATISTVNRLTQITRHIMSNKLSEKLVINDVDFHGKRVLMRYVASCCVVRPLFFFFFLTLGQSRNVMLLSFS